MVHVTQEVQKQILRLYLEQGRTQKSIADEFGIGPSVVGRIIRDYRKECQTNRTEAENLRLMEENRKLREENAELKKEADFLKKAMPIITTERAGGPGQKRKRNGSFR